MKHIKVKCPAKINLDLKVVNKREDGFHNIDSTMQTINLFDYLDIQVTKSEQLEILLSGNNKEIPYDEKNLVYKATKLFLDEIGISNVKVQVYIEKYIPVSAGLAGGSTNAAGMIWGLNKIFDNCLNEAKLHSLCAKLGSDLNVCLTGGCLKTSGRGEVITPTTYTPYKVRLIKPINLGISAKEAYTKFAYKYANSIDLDSRGDFKNDLEWAILSDYPQLQFIKSKYKTSMMTGSGSTYFSLEDDFETEDGYWVNNSLETIEYGVSED